MDGEVVFCLLREEVCQRESWVIILFWKWNSIGQVSLITSGLMCVPCIILPIKINQVSYSYFSSFLLEIHILVNSLQLTSKTFFHLFSVLVLDIFEELLCKSFPRHLFPFVWLSWKSPQIVYYKGVHSEFIVFGVFITSVTPSLFP